MSGRRRREREEAGMAELWPEVEVAGVWLRASGTRSSSWQRRKTTGEEAVVGWAGEAGPATGRWAEESPSNSLSLFLFICSVCFYFIFATVFLKFKTVSKIVSIIL